MFAGGAIMTRSLAAPVADRRPTSRSTPFRRVREDAFLLLDAERCLRLRSRYSDCEKCAQACPPRVLHMRDEGFGLADGCLRRGRCSAACPTGALQVDGFPSDLLRIPEQSESPLHVDCWKVPASESPANAVRVPCLGGIAMHHLVQWHSASGQYGIVLIDRGWCGQCSAGCGSVQPAQEALDASRALLEELGVPERSLPRLLSLPLPRAHMPASIPEAPAAQPLSRREFFASFSRGAVRTVAPAVVVQHDEQAQSRRARSERVESTPHSRMIARAIAIGSQRGRPVPAELFPALRVSDACRNHKVCAATCPTRALQAYRSDVGRTEGIAYDAVACIACGDCTRSCPERALTLIPQSNGKAPHGPTELTRWTLRECCDCGHEFADSSSGNICQPCRKTRELARAGFPQLFGSAFCEIGEQIPGELSKKSIDIMHITGKERT